MAHCSDEPLSIPNEIHRAAADTSFSYTGKNFDKIVKPWEKGKLSIRTIRKYEVSILFHVDFKIFARTPWKCSFLIFWQNFRENSINFEKSWYFPFTLLKIACFHWFFYPDFYKFVSLGGSAPEPLYMHISNVFIYLQKFSAKIL